MNKIKYQISLVLLLVFMMIPSQKKAAKEPLPPRPQKVAGPPEAKRPPEPLLGNVTFGWKNEPETLTTFTPTDLVERYYTFNDTFRVRVMSHYPLRSVTYKKPAKGEPEPPVFGYTMKDDSYDSVDVKGNTILISDKKDPKKEKISLEIIRKGKEITGIKEVKTGRIFRKSEYSVAPSL